MSGYKCMEAIIRGSREPILCRVSGDVCAHQRYCLTEGRIVLTDQALSCPGRNGIQDEKSEEGKNHGEAGQV